MYNMYLIKNVPLFCDLRHLFSAALRPNRSKKYHDQTVLKCTFSGKGMFFFGPRHFC